METATPATVLEARRGSDDPLADDDRFRDLLADDDEARGDGRIRCPRCGWQPGPGDRWLCTCGWAWNTFDTHGRCPECGRRWLTTQCLRCGAWSPHEEWYAEEPGPPPR